MQRRLDVALGLVHRPEVLFLDEPTTGLDPEARTAMREEITRLAGDDGLTILLTTHCPQEADGLAERIAVVDRGRVVAEGSPDGLKGELRGDAVHMELREPAGRRAPAGDGARGVRRGPRGAAGRPPAQAPPRRRRRRGRAARAGRPGERGRRRRLRHRRPSVRRWTTCT